MSNEPTDIAGLVADLRWWVAVLEARNEDGLAAMIGTAADTLESLGRVKATYQTRRAELHERINWLEGEIVRLESLSRPVEGSWAWALERMKEGKRVQHPGMDGIECWHIGKWRGFERVFLDDMDGMVSVEPEDMERTDWRIVED